MQHYGGRGRRVRLLDELRGLCILVMVLYHGAYDLVMLFGVDIPIFFHPVLQDFLQPLFAGLFVLISGIACRFSHSNLKRGILVLALGLAMTGVTYLVMPGQAIWFGILHLLGSCMILFGLYENAIFRRRRPDLLPAFWGMLLFLLLFAATYRLPDGWVGFRLIGRDFSLALPEGLYRFNWLAPLGFRPEEFLSADYFPLIPWAFLFFAGADLGVFFRQNAMPELFYRGRFPFLEKVGRHTLWIYLLHQPVVYGLLWAVFRLLGALGLR